MKKQLQYDPAVFETCRPKCGSIQEAAEQAKLQAAKTFLSSFIYLVAWTQRGPGVDIAEVMNFKKTIVTRTGCRTDKLS